MAEQTQTQIQTTENTVIDAPATLTFAAEKTETKNGKATGVAYSGGQISQSWSGRPIYVDLAGMKFAQQIPLMASHDYSLGARLGVCEVASDGKQLTFTAEIDKANPIAQQVIAAGRLAPWQASIGAENHLLEALSENEKATVNGREVKGPAYIIRKSTLREISVVSLGADPATSLSIAAALQTAGVVENPTTKEPTMADNKTTPTAPAAENSELETVKAELAEVKAELAKVQAQAARPATPNISTPVEPALADVMAAALEQSMGLSVKDTRAADVAEKRYKGQFGLKQMYTEAAKAAGWAGNYLNEASMFDAVSAIKAGFSNLNLTGILGTAINRKIRQGWDYAESAWRAIAETVSVSDYKAFTSYILNAGGEYDEVPVGGTIPHGKLTEESYSNQVKRYGKMFAIDEIDIINDDLGAINQRAFAFGRGAGLKLNSVFWTLFQNDGSFFSSGNSNKVSSAGALSVANLNALVKAFKKQTDATGALTGLNPAVLLVPVALEATALGLYNDPEFRDTTASKNFTTGNPWRSKFKPVASAYLTNDDDYYLLADPQIAATIQVAFLNGQNGPVIESNPTSFDTFGIQYRAKFSFGVAFADPKAGVKGDKE